MNQSENRNNQEINSIIMEKLSAVINPATQKTLVNEERIKEVQLSEGKLMITYMRDGITPQQKKIIEKEIRDHLSQIIEVKDIFVKTISKNSEDVYQSVSSDKKASHQTNSSQTSSQNSSTGEQANQGQQDAQLKVGHGTVGQKKPVPHVNKVIAIGSGKGGVGKSTFTANLALSLAHLGLKVGVIDADIYGPSLPMIFGKRDEKPRATEQKKILPVEAYGIKMMSFGFFINENDPVIWRGPMLGGVLNQFLFDVDWGELDYLLVDLPPGTGDIQLSMIQNTHVDGAIIISTPQDIALLDAQKGLEMFKKLNLPILGMVENMSSFICDECGKEHFIFGKGGVSEAVSKIGTTLLGQIPLEIELRTGSDLGKPYMVQEELKGRAVWSSFEKIALKIQASFFPDSSMKSVDSEQITNNDHIGFSHSAGESQQQRKKTGLFSKWLGSNKS